MKSLIELADEVSLALKGGQKFREAVSEVLRQNKIDDWDYYFPAIGQVLGSRKKKPRKKHLTKKERNITRRLFTWKQIKLMCAQSLLVIKERRDDLLSDP